MANLKKPIGEILSDNQPMVSAEESDKMSKVAELMESSESREHLSQIPLKDDTGKIRYVVTGYGLAQWARTGHHEDKTYKFSESSHQFPYDTPLVDIIDIVANFGYVLVTDEDDWVVGILSYTEVIKELTQ